MNTWPWVGTAFVGKQVLPNAWGRGAALQAPLAEQCSGYQVYCLNGGKAGCPLGGIEGLGTRSGSRFIEFFLNSWLLLS